MSAYLYPTSNQIRNSTYFFVDISELGDKEEDDESSGGEARKGENGGQDTG